MRRPYPILPMWSGSRCLPLLACAALGFRVGSPAQTPALPARPGAPAGSVPTGGEAVSKPSSTLPEKAAVTNPADVVERGFLGVSLGELRPEVRAQTTLKEGEGLIINRVAIGSPAAEGGLIPYDILVRFNDQWVMSEKQVATLVENAGPGCEVNLTVLRKGREQKLTVSLCRSPKLEEWMKIRSLPLPPSQEEMLASVMHTFHENPNALETVWRMFHGPLTSNAGSEGELGAREPMLQRFAFWDEGGQVELIQSGNTQTLRAWDDQGRLVFEGPCLTPQQRAKVPADALVRLEALEKRRRNLQAPSSPSSTVIRPESSHPPSMEGTMIPAAPGLPSNAAETNPPKTPPASPEASANQRPAGSPASSR